MRGLRCPFLVLPILLLIAAAGGFAQTCQSHPGLTYATYADRNGVTQPLQLDLTVPDGAASPVPLVIWIHGGGWKSGDRTQVPAYVSDLCSRGYAVASLDYRLTTTALWPAQIQDCKTAVRWLRANAPSYNLDPDRFAAWGTSAGAHLAALLGTSGSVPSVTVGNTTVVLEDGRDPAGESSRVQAVVDWYGATDFLHMRFYPSGVGNHDAATSDESRLMGAAIQQVPERVATANPITYVTPDDPPFLVMHGTLDKTNPFNQSQLLVDALRAAGVPVTFKAVINAAHGGSLFNQPAAYQAAWSFLDAVLLGPPPPLSEPGGGASDPGTGPAVRVTASDSAASEAGADAGAFVLSRDGGTLSSLTVAYSLSGTATNGVDYGPLSGSVTIPAGQSAVTVSVPVVDDMELETAETVLLALEPDTGYSVGSPATAGVAVADDDLDPAKPIVSISPADWDAAEPGTDTGGFLVWRTGSTAAALTVSVLPAGSAEDGVDYVAIPQTVTLAAGADRAVVTVKPLDDWAFEPTETVALAVAPDPAIFLAPYTGTIVSLADDDPPGTPELASVSLSPASVLGSQTATGTVTLDVAAPTGGAAVSLASGDVNVATVPASVTVPAGSATATFTVTTKAVASATTVVISASRRGVTKSASLTVREPAVSSLAFTPPSFVGGCQTSTGKVSLSGKAPAGGLVVPLSSAHPAAVLPASVTVAAGATSATFPVTALAVDSVQSGTVTASYGGASKSASLSVRPVGVLALALAPNPVTGPASVTGTVTLECAAPGDVAVALSSSSPALASPSAGTLVIPAGTSSATFTLAAADVAVVSYATIQAVANGVAKSVKLTINP